ncbi:hypothetical protein C8R43DRAFT_1112638 [Mycena crocata]|nr:hypothetical protein C8R43DRAFT_1112638 [Mycena crocata]
MISKSAFAVALSISAASLALASCTPSFTGAHLYTVRMTQNSEFVWVNNNTLGFLGVDLKSTVPATNWFLFATGFGGYGFSVGPDMTSCLYASRNAKVPGSGKIYNSIGCYDGAGELDLDEDFTFSCAGCDAHGGTSCFIKSSVTKECANTPVNGLRYPSGQNEEGQIRTATCGNMWYQTWDVRAVV